MSDETRALTTDEMRHRQFADGLPVRVVVGANGAYWRDFGDHYSMCPVSTDNEPVEVVAVYVPATVALRLTEAIAMKAAIDDLYASGMRDDWRERMNADREHDAALAALRTAIDGRPR